MRTALTVELVRLDREYADADPGPQQPWEEFYAERLVNAFA